MVSDVHDWNRIAKVKVLPVISALFNTVSPLAQSPVCATVPLISESRRLYPCKELEYDAFCVTLLIVLPEGIPFATISTVTAVEVAVVGVEVYLPAFESQYALYVLLRLTFARVIVFVAIYFTPLRIQQVDVTRLRGCGIGRTMGDFLLSVGGIVACMNNSIASNRSAT